MSHTAITTDQSPFLDLRTYFLGCAKVRLKFLDCEAYEKRGCLQYGSGNHTRVMVSRETLNRVCEISTIDPKQVLDSGVHHVEPPLTELPLGAKLHVLTERDQVLAAQKYHPDEWWTVELYTEGKHAMIPAGHDKA